MQYKQNQEQYLPEFLSAEFRIQKTEEAREIYAEKPFYHLYNVLKSLETTEKNSDSYKVHLVRAEIAIRNLTPVIKDIKRSEKQGRQLPALDLIIQKTLDHVKLGQA